VVLDGKHTYCVPESPIPGKGTGGAGLCNEFGIFKAVGYDEAKPGEWFLKPGVGLLKKENEEDYNFFKPYKVSAFTYKITIEKSRIMFESLPLECNGYAVSLVKVLSVENNYLNICYTLENKGRKNITTNEYCHNFIGIDKHLIGPDYQLSFPYRVTVENTPLSEIIKTEGNKIIWKGTPTKDFYCQPGGFEAGKPHVWELVHIPTGVGIKEYSDLPASRVALWGSSHVVSPEVFTDINLAPEEVCQWSRRYEFFS
jgi:hypothetical protein